MNYLSTHQHWMGQVFESMLLVIALLLTIEFGPEWIDFFENSVSTVYHEFSNWLSWKYEPTFNF